MKNIWRYGLTCFAALVITLSTTNAQPSEKTVNAIKDSLKKFKDLKDEEAIKAMAKWIIHAVDTGYKISQDNVNDEPVYDPTNPSCEPGVFAVAKLDGKKVKVIICAYCLENSPGWVAVIKVHEMIGHGGQALAGNWYDDTKGSNIQEVEAWDKAIDSAKKWGLSKDEIARLEKCRNQYYKDLNEANKNKVDAKNYLLAFAEPPQKSREVLVTGAEVYVSGEVLSDELIRVTVRGNGNAVSGMVLKTEVDGKSSETKTDNNGHAILDISTVTAGLVAPAVAVIKVINSKGNVIAQKSTAVKVGSKTACSPPLIEKLPSNIQNNSVVTIPGHNLGAESKMIIGEQTQEVLSASDKELTIFCNSATGNQPAFAITPNGESISQKVNIYDLNFTINKNTIGQHEEIAGQIWYSGLPKGTDVLIKNMSPATVKLSVKKSKTDGNNCIFRVTKSEGTIPVKITGISQGNFSLSADPVFRE